MTFEFQDKQVLIWSIYGEEYVVVDEDEAHFYCYGDDKVLEANDLKMLKEGCAWYKFEELTDIGKVSVVEAFDLYDQYLNSLEF